MLKELNETARTVYEHNEQARLAGLYVVELILIACLIGEVLSYDYQRKNIPNLVLYLALGFNTLEFLVCYFKNKKIKNE